MGGGTSRFSRSGSDDQENSALKEIIAAENRNMKMSQGQPVAQESRGGPELKVEVSGDPESDDDSGPEVDEFGNPRIKFQKNPRRSSFSELPDAAEPTVPVTVEGGGDEVVYEGGEVLTKSSAPGLPVNFDVAKIEREKDRNKSKKGFKTMKTTDLIRKPQADDTATPVHTGLTRPVNWDPERNREAMETVEFGALHFYEPGKHIGQSSLTVDLFGGFGGGEDDAGLEDMFAQKGISMGEFHILNAGSELLKAQQEKCTFHTGPGQDDGEREGMVDFGNFHIEGAGQALKAASLPVCFGGGAGGGDDGGFEVSFGGGTDDDMFAGRELPAMGDFHIFAPGKQLMQPGSASFFEEPKDEHIAEMPVNFGEFFIAGAPGAQTAKSTVVEFGGGGLNVSIGGFGEGADGPMGMSAEMPVLRINNPQKTMYQPRASCGSMPGEEDGENDDMGLQTVNPGANLARKASLSNLEDASYEEPAVSGLAGDEDEECDDDAEKVVRAAKDEDESEEEKDPYPARKKKAKAQESSSEEDSDSGSDCSSDSD